MNNEELAFILYALPFSLVLWTALAVVMAGAFKLIQEEFKK